MKSEFMEKAVALGKKRGFVFLTTVDDHGIPHLTVATRVSVTPDHMLSVTEWFCPQTVRNLESNPVIGVTAWDERSDSGYQLFGKKEALREVAVLDGYTPQAPKTGNLPQVEREVLISVERILEFKRSPHSDTEI